jgi:hypothetical protein
MPAPLNPAKKFSPELSEAFIRYFETHNAAKLYANLRRMLLDYLSAELRVGVPLFLDEFLWQLGDLFELLDTVSGETQGWHQPVTRKNKKKSKS